MNFVTLLLQFTYNCLLNNSANFIASHFFQKIYLSIQKHIDTGVLHIHIGTHMCVYPYVHCFAPCFSKKFVLASFKHIGKY